MDLSIFHKPSIQDSNKLQWRDKKHGSMLWEMSIADTVKTTVILSEHGH